MIDPGLVYVIHEERQREAEEMRFDRENFRKVPPLRERLLIYIGDRLIAVGNRLKSFSAAQASAASLDKSPGAV